MATSEEDVNRHDDSHVTAQQWKWTVLAGMASYLDAGSIVALAAGLALWQQYLGMSSTTVGLLAALGPNAVGAAIGALIGGRLANCSACCVPEISNAFERAAIPFNLVSGTLHDDEHAWAEIEGWCHAATALGTLRGSRFGFLGHTYPGMLDMYSDFTMHQAQLGLHVEVLEMDDLQDRVHHLFRVQNTLL